MFHCLSDFLLYSFYLSFSLSPFHFFPFFLLCNQNEFGVSQLLTIYWEVQKIKIWICFGLFRVHISFLSFSFVLWKIMQASKEREQKMKREYMENEFIFSHMKNKCVHFSLGFSYNTYFCCCCFHYGFNFFFSFSVYAENGKCMSM